MKNLLILLNFALFSLNSYAQTDKISVTKETKYTINEQTITESDNTQISKSKLLKKMNDKETYIVEYDFKTGLYNDALLKPKVDRPIVFKIKNINRLAFKVTVNHSDGVFAQTDWFTTEQNFKKIERVLGDNKQANEEFVAQSVQTPNLTVRTDDSTAQRNEVANLNDTNKLNAELLLKQQELNELKLKQTKSEYFKTVFGVANITAEDEDSIETELNYTLQQISDIKTRIKNNEKQLGEKLKKFSDVSDNFNRAYFKFNESNANINIIFNASKKVIPFAFLPFLNKMDYVDENQKEFRLILVHLASIDLNLNTMNNQFIELTLSYNKLINVEGLQDIFDIKEQKDYLKNVEILYENAKNIKLRGELLDFENLSSKVQRIIQLLEKDETYEYISKPIQPKNDVAIFDVEIIARNNDIEVNNSRKFKHSEFVRRGTRIDFSIGLAGSYFDNANVYEIYTKDSVNKIGLKNKHLTAPCLVTMITMTNRSSKYCAFGGSAGLGIDVINGKIQMSNFFVGPTLILGKYDRMMFTPGFTLRNVGKLKGDYVVDSIITQTTDINSILSDNYKVGYFVALTYNLTDNVREKIKKY